jgi:hypothetical protein
VTLTFLLLNRAFPRHCDRALNQRRFGAIRMVWTEAAANRAGTYDWRGLASAGGLTRVASRIRRAEPRAHAVDQAAETTFGRIVWLLVALAPLFVMGQFTGINLIDAWWNFGLGHLMLIQRQLITNDPFSFTPTVAEAINQQWLAQLAWAAAYDGAGPAGVLAVRAATIALVGLFLWSIGRDLGASRRALAAASLLAAFQLSEFFQIRAQIFAFALAAAVLWCLQRGGRTSWLVVALAAVWANVHGSFPLAPCFAAAFAVGSLAQSRSNATQYAAIAVAAALSTLANPYGAQVWRYAVDLSSNEAMRKYLSEWAPTTLQDLTGKVFFVYLAAGAALYAWRRPRVPVTWMLLTVALAAFALTAVRNVPWLALVSLPVWALLLTGCFASLKDRTTPVRTLRVMLLAIVACVAIAIGKVAPAPLPLQILPGAAMSDDELTLSDLSDYVLTHPGGPVLNDANWGAYLEAHVSPSQQVFIDTRYEVHPTSVWDDYNAVMAARFDWQSILDKYGVQRIAVDPEHSVNLVRALEASGAWSEVWQTDHGNSHAVVWSRAA